MKQEIYDFLIVGSGFGGSVSAMRLAQKGYRVAVLEEGKVYQNKDFPKSNWDIKKYLWAPFFRCFGIQKITFLKKLMILHGSGVGGGSLVYANTLMRPLASVFKQKAWPSDIDWEKELSEHYSTAKKMLGVVPNPHLAENDLAIKALGEKMGCADTFHPTEVGIFFGTPDQKVPDPYFSGDGPERTGCSFCGSCMIGCPNGAKNTLDKNYLYFAQKWGAEIISETRADRIIPHDDFYFVTSIRSTSFLNSPGATFKAKKVILAAGVLGTIKLLLKNKILYGHLNKISDQLGMNVGSNGESLLGATSFKETKDYSKGIAIGSAIHPDPYTKIEGVRYPSGSNFLRLMAVPLAGEGGFFLRPLKMFLNFILKFSTYIKLFFVKDWAKNTVILLVMQTVESKIRLGLGRSPLTFFQWGTVSKKQEGEIPSYLPIAQEAASSLADLIEGGPQNIFSEVFFGTPATAHILGGANLGNNRNEGVISSSHQVFEYPGLYVMDASVIASNLGVNPSLTICALAERFSSQFPVNPDKINFTSPLIHFTGR